MRRTYRTFVAVALTVAAIGALVGAEAQAANATPVLAGPWAPHQQGYGRIKPTMIYNGGDPTGIVKNIQWTSWGGRQAIGTGTGFWVGPKQFVAEGHFEGAAKIVLFQLGRCHGRSAYNAIEWYFPAHGQKFSPDTYINACTGKYYFNGHAGP